MKKKSQQSLPTETANQILSNVFEQCGTLSNDIPLEVLQNYSNYRKERFNLQRTVITLILVIFLLLPVFFVVPPIVITLRNEYENANPIYDVQISTRIPVQEIQAMISGRNMPIYEAASHQYVITPNANGEMQVSVMLANRQYNSIQITITNVDSDAPVLVSTDITSNYIRLYLEDEESGIDFDSIVVEADGTPVQAYEINRAQSFVSVAYPEVPLTVRVCDQRGNELKIVLKTD